MDLDRLHFQHIDYDIFNAASLLLEMPVSDANHRTRVQAINSIAMRYSVFTRVSCHRKHVFNVHGVIRPIMKLKYNSNL